MYKYCESERIGPLQQVASAGLAADCLRENRTKFWARGESSAIEVRTKFLFLPRAGKPRPPLICGGPAFAAECKLRPSGSQAASCGQQVAGRADLRARAAMKRSAIASCDSLGPKLALEWAPNGVVGARPCLGRLELLLRRCKFVSLVAFHFSLFAFRFWPPIGHSSTGLACLAARSHLGGRECVFQARSKRVFHAERGS